MSPKSQAHEETDPPEASLKPTLRGAVPEVGLAENPAVGAGSVTEISLLWVAVSPPPGPVTVRDTE